MDLKEMNEIRENAKKCLGELFLAVNLLAHAIKESNYEEMKRVSELMSRSHSVEMTEQVKALMSKIYTDDDLERMVEKLG